MSTDYQALYETYPETISLEQLYRICHISKRKGAWLLQNGYIPCTDTGKKTRRYKIKLDDVVAYLKAMETGTKPVPHPKGLFTCQKQKPVVPHHTEPMSPDARRILLAREWSQVPDALSTREAADVTGLSQSTILKKIQRQELQAVKTPRGILIAKEWLLDFMVNRS